MQTGPSETEKRSWRSCAWTSWCVRSLSLLVAAALDSSACPPCSGLHGLLPRPLHTDHEQGADLVCECFQGVGPCVPDAHVFRRSRCAPSSSLPATMLPPPRCRACGEWRECASRWRLQVIASECMRVLPCIMLRYRKCLRRDNLLCACSLDAVEAMSEEDKVT